MGVVKYLDTGLTSFLPDWGVAERGVAATPLVLAFNGRLEGVTSGNGNLGG